MVKKVTIARKKTHLSFYDDFVKVLFSLSCIIIKHVWIHLPQ